MMRSGVVSVIVPVYNTEEYLERCVRSLLIQTYELTEIILVNDGSTDNSPEICKRLSVEYENIHVVNRKNGGISQARNSGLESASGEYIAFVDSDDCVDSRMLEICVNALRRHDSDIVGFDWQCFHNVLPNVTYKDKEIIKKDKFVERYFLENNRLYCVVRYMYKKELIDKNNLFFDSAIKSGGEDQLYIFRYIQHCRKAVFLKYDGYFYFENGSSATSGAVKDNHYNDLNVRKEICDSCRKDCKSRAAAHLMKGYLAFCIKAIKNGTECKEDIISNYRKIICKNLLKILCSPHIGLKYKAAAFSLNCSIDLTKKLSEKTKL